MSPGPVASAGVDAVGDGVVAGGEVRRHRVVGAEDLGPVDLGQVAVEGVDDRVEGAVVVEVVGLDVGEDGAGEGQLEVGAVALVGLDHQPPPAGPVRARAHLVQVAADDEARIEPGLGQHHGQHRGRGRLAVRAGHGQRVGLRADGRQHPRPPEHRDAVLGGGDELDVPGRDGGRGGDGVDALDVVPVVADVDGDARSAQPVERGQLAEVAAGHVVAHLGQGQGDGAHPRPTHADDVVAAGAREVERGVERGSSIHRAPGRFGARSRARPPLRSGGPAGRCGGSPPRRGPRRPWPAASTDRLAAARSRAPAGPA